MVMVIDLAASHSPFYLFPLSSSSPKVHIHRNIGWFQTDRERERERVNEREAEDDKGAGPKSLQTRNKEEN